MNAVTFAQVNSFLWCKQHLASEALGSDPLEVVEDVVGLHATAPTTPYLSLRARMASFDLDSLDRLLYVDRTVVKVLCMRQTVHAIPSRHVGSVLACFSDRIHKATERELVQLAMWSGETHPERQHRLVTQWQSTVEEYFTSHGPATAAEVTAALPALQGKIHYAPDKPYGGTVSIGSMLLPRLTALGLLVRGRARGTWRSNLHEYALASQWLPSTGEVSPPAEVARASLMRHYLGAFGPVTLEDAAWWTGWSKKETQGAIAALQREVAQVDVHDVNQPLVLLAQDLEPLGDARPLSARTVRLLPCLDGYIMGYKERARFLDPAHYDHVFDRSGNAYSTVWADGRVIGIWSEDKDSLVCYLWQAGWDDEVMREANSLASFLRRADGRPGEGERPVRILPYPDGLYVRTPFTLAVR